MTSNSVQPEGSIPLFAATENPLTQEVQADDVFFVSPTEYRRLMVEIFCKVATLELADAKDEYYGIPGKRQAVVTAADFAFRSAEGADDEQ